MKTFGELYESLWANIHKKRHSVPYTLSVKPFKKITSNRFFC